MNITSFKIVVFVLYRNVVKEYSVKHGLMFKELLKIGEVFTKVTIKLVLSLLFREIIVKNIFCLVIRLK